MKPFTYNRATETQVAIERVARDGRAEFLAGGTNLLDLMKSNIEQPDHLTDINLLALSSIEPLPNNGVRIGALTSNSAVAAHPLIRERYPMLSQAILSGATQQLRNMATVGGNLLQRTRCYYFYDVSLPCNKRVPSSGCAAKDSYNRIHAILGTSEQCIATHPSDMCVALAALDAVVQTQKVNGEQHRIPILDFHCLPGNTPHIETVLERGELITAVDLPALPIARKSVYLKVRDRASYAFALVSVAAALDIQGGNIQAARLALGGVGTKPWRAQEAEQILVGASPDRDTFERAATATVRDARPQEDNRFKVELAQRTIVRALSMLMAA